MMLHVLFYKKSQRKPTCFNRVSMSDQIVNYLASSIFFTFVKSDFDKL